MIKIEPHYYVHRINGEIPEYVIEDGENEYQRINEELQKIDIIDLEIIINTDIPFRIHYNKVWKKYQSFNDFLKDDIIKKRQIYLLFLRDILFFPNLTFQQN